MALPPPPPPQTINPNVDPTAISCKKTVVLRTTDQLSNWSTIPEAYNVHMPNIAGSIITTITGTNKKVIKLGTVSGQDYYLKVHFPNIPNIDKVFVTYCVRDTTVQDGYLDYVNGVPADFITALRGWISSGYTLTPAFQTIVKKIKFTAYGITTNIPANAVTFYVAFTGTFSTTSR